MTVPDIPEGTRKLVSLTSKLLAENRRRSFSSGVNWVSPFGVTLPPEHRRLDFAPM